MTTPANEAGVLAVLVDRLEKQRLPRILDIKARVDKGETLTDPDIRFLGEAMEDALKVKPLIDNHPEYQELARKVTGLYKEVTDKALANQERAAG